jgi:hypothetical protein
MYQSKRFAYTYNDQGKTAADLLQEIMEDAQLPELDEIVIGAWGDNCWDEGEEGVQIIIDGIVANKEKFSHVTSLFFGDMGYEDCEVSWIIQGNYSKLWEAMPQLERLVIKGSNELVLGEITHQNLQQLEIICGGLPESVIASIQKAKLPALQKLVLYIGVEDYGFDGDISTIRDFLAESDFPQLTYLGVTDSEIQDEITEVVLDCKYLSQITTLDLSFGTMTDKGGEMLLKKLPEYPNIKKVELIHHFMSDEMVKQLQNLSDIQVNVADQQEADDYGGEIYYYAMLTE